MKTILSIIILATLVSVTASAQPTTFQDSLLDHLVGNWTLHGTIASGETTHDVAVGWVLGHQYLQIHEISYEKNPDGSPVYEAIVYIGWDQPAGQYACLWLDVTGGGGLNGQAIGHGKRGHNEIPFLFNGSDGSTFHNTFVYDSTKGSWKWLMDNESNGKLQPFARLVLARKS